MEFIRPDSIDAAVAALQAENAACLAGGATLVAMMNADLVAPERLVSLRDVAALRTAMRQPDGSVVIGAMRRHRETAEETDLRDGQRVLSDAAGQIANPPVRNMGTIGGSCAFADPAADYPPALAAADARIALVGAEGRRTLPADAFFVDWYETALEPGELIESVILPPAPAGTAGSYTKLARVAGDFAIASVALVLGMEGDACSHLAVAVGACGPAPVRRRDVETELLGGGLGDSEIRRLTDALADGLDPVDDVRASADYRRRVAPRLVRQAIAEAKQCLSGTQ
ncbi:MAG: xanthine dehydrogenase family protein subunit M [Rhodospirillaceae bacterium]|nr:xanthine dehydrogenase family protein subunit M [Rhodospirillaceae bacterium]